MIRIINFNNLKEEKVEKKLLFGLVAFVCVLASYGTAGAALINIQVAYDVSLSPHQPDWNINNTGHPYLWVGDADFHRDNYETMFGFDMTGLTGLSDADDTLTINSITFNAWNNANIYDGFVDIGLGNTDNQDPDAVTWNTGFGDHGGALDSVYQSDDNLNSQVSWDVSTINSDAVTDDDFLTFYLFTSPLNQFNWHDYEAEEWTDNHEAFLTVDYTINSQSVPEPSTLCLLGAGLLTLFIFRIRIQLKV